MGEIHQSSILFPDMGLTYADFFCGCGGLSLGFIKAGLKCISAMDNAPDALWTFWYNLCYKGWSHFWVHPDNPDLKRIAKWNNLDNGKTGNYLFPYGVPDNWLSPKIEEPMPCANVFLYSIMDLEPEDWMEMCGVRPGDIKIFAGGPPCQGFSTANSVDRNIYNEKNQLPLRFIYYIKICRPDHVLMENVPGLLSLGRKKGEKEGPFVRWIRDAFDEAGYNMEYQVHDAADYGVPQRRKRVLFFATRKGLEHIPLPEKTHGSGLEPYVNVMEAIGHLPPTEAGERYDGKAYGYNKKKGYVICNKCLHYVKEERIRCQYCGHKLDNPIKGGVFRIPGFATLIDCQKEIDLELTNNMK